MLRGRLEAEGIQAWVAFGNHVGVNWLLSNAIGGAHVQVSADMAETALSVAQRCHEGGYKADLRARLGDIDDIRCPHCGSTDLRKSRPTIPVLLAFIITLPYLLLPAWRWVRVCQTCKRQF